MMDLRCAQAIIRLSSCPMEEGEALEAIVAAICGGYFLASEEKILERFSEQEKVINDIYNIAAKYISEANWGRKEHE